uniref:Uncharacterized protein n=1 Tax=viral metagenome TaxID=1070528 RepID=A0A6M3M8B4_9ZZZZ
MAGNDNWVQVKKAIPSLLISTAIIVGYALLVRIFALKGK